MHSPAPVELPDQFNLAGHFVDRHIREGRGNKIAIAYDGERLTYAEVTAQVNRTGHALRRIGVQTKQRVLLVLPDIPEFAAAYFGTIKVGAVAVPTSTALRAADYTYFLEECEAKVAIVHSSLLPEFGPAALTRPQCQVVVCGDAIEGYLHWNEFLKDTPAELEAAPTRKNDIAFWLWTSGSTGRPKAAVHAHQDWVYCCENYACSVLEISEDDVMFSSSKLFHAYGLGNALMFPFHVGASTVLFAGKPHAKAILDQVETSRPTLFFSVPTLFAAMLQEAERAPYQLSSVRLAASAAEPLPADIFRRWKERFGVDILDGIGSTEVLHIYISARAGQIRPGSTGQCVPGYELALVDHQGQPVSPGAIGDLLVAGRSTSQYYWNRKELTQDRMRGRWFFTGDKYKVDEDGYYWYAGRADDMFRVSGQWVSPVEVEAALIAHRCVLEAAVIAFEETTGLHTPQAFVVLRDGFAGGDALAKELQDFVKQQITPYKYPRRIEFVGELPKTAAGKLLRYKLREISRVSAMQ
jgi:benzoate-CoA ligase